MRSMLLLFCLCTQGRQSYSITEQPETTWGLRNFVSTVFQAVTRQLIRVSRRIETHFLSQAYSMKLPSRLIHTARKQRGQGLRREDRAQTTHINQGGPFTLFFHLGHRAAPTGWLEVPPSSERAGRGVCGLWGERRGCRAGAFRPMPGLSSQQRGGSHLGLSVSS